MAAARFIIPFLALVFGLALGIKLPQNPDENPEPLKWWQQEIIYQVYPRSHQDSDGDGVGDLAGIQSRLDHFDELGVGAVWISPIYKSPMKDFGYDISNFTDIEPQFGTLESFKNLSSALKERNIKLIMDFVPNHSSDEHPWFNMSINREGIYDDFYVWKDPKGINSTTGEPIPPNNWMSVFGGSAWTFNEQRQQFYLHQFVAGQPDLNYENPEVTKAILAAVKFWLDMGVDGFRVDAVPHLFENQTFADEPVDPNRPPTALPTDWAYYQHIYTYNLPGVFDFLARFRELLDIYTWADGIERVMFVEAGVPTLDLLMEYYGTPERPIAHFPFNFEFINRVKSGFNGTNIGDVVDEWFTKMPEGQWANWLVGNHDNGRVGSRFSPSAGIVDAFNALVLLLPGNAVTYYGEEIGMQNANISWEDTVDPAGCQVGPDRYQQFSRDPERTPMHWNDDQNAGFSTANKTWLPMHPDYPEVNVEAQKNSTENSHLKVYQLLSALRQTDVWRYGSLESQAPENGSLFGFSRIYNGKGFICLFNFVDEIQTINVPQVFENIPQNATVYSTSVGFQPETAVGTTIGTDNVVIGARHSIILEF
ncbi:unnamed protein product [Orchesella dallaii]|uniref:alpha-glucosidase n=1 Tax=Orchesella dallaii TaxID=48710 RepID=A0ABP1RR65_9HEXA